MKKVIQHKPHKVFSYGETNLFYEQIGKLLIKIGEDHDYLFFEEDSFEWVLNARHRGSEGLEFSELKPTQNHQLFPFYVTLSLYVKADETKYETQRLMLVHVDWKRDLEMIDSALRSTFMMLIEGIEETKREKEKSDIVPFNEDDFSTDRHIIEDVDIKSVGSEIRAVLTRRTIKGDE